MLDPQDRSLRAGVREVGVAGGAQELGHLEVAIGPGVEDEEATVGGVVGVECQPQQTALAAGGDLARDVQERRGEQAATADDPDPTGLLDDEQASIPRIRHQHRVVKPADHWLKGDDRVAGRPHRCRGREERRGREQRGHDPEGDEPAGAPDASHATMVRRMSTHDGVTVAP